MTNPFHITSVRFVNWKFAGGMNLIFEHISGRNYRIPLWPFHFLPAKKMESLRAWCRKHILYIRLWRDRSSDKVVVRDTTFDYIFVNGRIAHRLSKGISRNYHEKVMGVAVKIGKQAIGEIELYTRNIVEEDRKYFAPVLGYGDNWIAKKWIETPENSSDNTTAKQDKLLRDLARRYSINDLHSHNYGVTEDGELFIWDWGLNEYCQLDDDYEYNTSSYIASSDGTSS